MREGIEGIHTRHRWPAFPRGRPARNLSGPLPCQGQCTAPVALPALRAHATLITRDTICNFGEPRGTSGTPARPLNHPPTSKTYRVETLALINREGPGPAHIALHCHAASTLGGEWLSEKDTKKSNKFVDCESGAPP